MAAEKVDRRVRYTKRALTQALVQLVQERPVSKISVKELCERADVNRSTFYAHFRNPHDLLQSIENDALADLKAHLLADDKPRTASVVKVLEYAQDNAEVFLMLLEESDGGFQRQIMELAHLVDRFGVGRINQLVSGYSTAMGIDLPDTSGGRGAPR